MDAADPAIRAAGPATRVEAIVPAAGKALRFALPAR
jgi:hypothetical protein